jgi:hypothetical protein
MAEQAWPWALSALTLASFWVIGKKRRSGWLFALGTEGLWLLWSVLYHQWGFLASVIPFSALYARNWWLWREGDRDGSGA